MAATRRQRRIVFDGATLSLDAAAPGRTFLADARCFEGEAVPAFAHVCAATGDAARLPFDMPEVQEARRDALAWWIGMLGADLVCLTTLALDSVHFGGAITVARSPGLFRSDPFARIFAGTVVETGIFCPVPPPPGPPIERYAGVPWPGGRFGSKGPGPLEPR